MPIEQIPGGGHIITGDSIPLFRLLALRGRLRLEIKGLGFRGKSTSAILKQEFGWKGNKEKLLAQLNAYILEKYGRNDD